LKSTEDPYTGTNPFEAFSGLNLERERESSKQHGDRKWQAREREKRILLV
jgi:hypothetical protein